MKKFFVSLLNGATTAAKALDYKSIIIPGILVSLELLMVAVKRYNARTIVECDPEATVDVVKRLQ